LALISTTGVVPLNAGAEVPSIVVFVLIAGRSLCSVIVPRTVNVMAERPLVAGCRPIEELPVVCAFASRMADLRLPAPESFKELTFSELAGAGAGAGGFAAVNTAPPPLHPDKTAAATSKSTEPKLSVCRRPNGRTRDGEQNPKAM
jgi:hypothetical protein